MSAAIAIRLLALVALPLLGAAILRGGARPSEGDEDPHGKVSQANLPYRALPVFFALAAAGVVIMAFIDLRLAAAGWLFGFVFCSQAPIGSVVLLMIHRLTGGRWGEQLRPALESAALCVPVMFLFLIPVFLAAPMLFAWVHGAGTDDVRSYYLNMPFFIGRSALAFAGWSILALLIPRISGRGGELLAAGGLAFHCLIIGMVSVDWALSLEAPFISSSFGASVGVTQLIAALAWAALRSPLPRNDPATGDIGGLLLAFVLGITYLDFMAFLVIWYSDLPHKVFWFVERDRFPWTVIAAVVFVIGSVSPILSLLLSRVRNDGLLLKVVSCAALVGLAFYYVYIVLPPFGTMALVPGFLALAAISLVLTMLARAKRNAAAEHRGVAYGR